MRKLTVVTISLFPFLSDTRWHFGKEPKTSFMGEAALITGSVTGGDCVSKYGTKSLRGIPNTTSCSFALGSCSAEAFELKFGRLWRLGAYSCGKHPTKFEHAQEWTLLRRKDPRKKVAIARLQRDCLNQPV
jgi:hypothetical protein